MYYLDKFGGSDEVDGVLVVFLHACTDGEDVGVKDDVAGVKSHLADQQLVGPSADLDFTVCICGLKKRLVSTRECFCVNVCVCVFDSSPVPPRRRP